MEREVHPSFRLMNEAFGMDKDLIPKGNLLIPVSGRVAEIDCGMNGGRGLELDETDGGSAQTGSDEQTLSYYLLESRQPGRRKHITIEGEGGIGKTVALLSLALEPELFPEDVLVIYIQLHRLNRMQLKPEKVNGKLNWFIESYMKDVKCGCTDEEVVAFHELCGQATDDTPRVILLLDGYNEMLNDLKREIRIEINDWASKPGVQIITTSRTPWSCGKDFMMIRLKPLDRDIIRRYLERTGTAIPAQGDNLWDVINYPLMLTMYTHISAVQKQAREGMLENSSDDVLKMRDIFWHPMNKAGDIIWNYIQKELVRCGKEMDVRIDTSLLEDYTVAILHSAPYIAWRMSQKNAFSILREDNDETGEELLSFTDLICESISCLKEEWDWSDQLKRIINKWGRERWKRLAKDFGSEASLGRAEAIERILLNEVSLFRIRENTDNISESPVEVVEMMHQQFRDGLAAVWLCQRIGTMEKPVILNKGTFRSTGDKYALPLCWREKIGRYVLQFTAEILSEKEAGLFWEAGRVYQPTDVRFVYTMLNLMSERSVINGIHENDFRNSDFSGMDLRQISMFYYKQEGHLKLRLPHKEDHGKLVGTAIARGTFESQGHDGQIDRVSISGDGKRAVSVGTDGRLLVWDLENMICEKELAGHDVCINTASISNDGKRAVSGGSDGNIRVWNLEDMTCEKKLEGHDGWIRSVSISNDRKRAVSGGFDGLLRVWDLDGFTCEKELKGHDRWIRSVSISSDGKRAVSGGFDGFLRVWDLDGFTCEKELEGHDGWIGDVSISSDGKRAVSFGEDGKLLVWDLKGMACEKILKEGNRSCYSMSVSISSDGKRAISGEDDGIVRVWDLEGMTCEKELSGHDGGIGDVSINSNGKRTVSGGFDGILRVWNLEDMTCEKELEGYNGEIYSLSISADAKRAVSGGNDGIVRVWNLEDMTCEKGLSGHDGWINSVTISNDGKRAVSGGNDGIVRVWNLEDMVCEKELPGHDEWIRSVSISSDSKRAVSGGFDGILRVWNLEDMTCEMELEEHSGWIGAVSISSDGKRAVSGGSDGIVRFWTREGMKELGEHNGWIRAVSISNDGKRAVSGGFDGILRVWDLERMICEAELAGHSGWIRAVSISNDGKRAVSGGFDGILRVWNLKELTCEAGLEGHEGMITSALISSDGKRAVSGGVDGSIRVWDFSDPINEIRISFFPDIDIVGIDFSKATIDSEETREILRQNGAHV